MLGRVGPLCGLVFCLLAQSAMSDALAWRPLKIDGHAVRWSKPVDSKGRQTLTWRLVNSAEHFDDAINCKSMVEPDALLKASRVARSAFRDELHAAFEMWEAAAGIRFVEAKSGERADIIIGSQAHPEGRAFADVAYDRQSSSETRAISRSLICLNPFVRWKVGFDGNLDVYDLRYTFAHEIGHAIGLDHPRQRGSLMWFRYDERLRGLQPADIDGAVALYGAAPAFTRSATSRMVAETPN